MPKIGGHGEVACGLKPKSINETGGQVALGFIESSTSNGSEACNEERLALDRSTISFPGSPTTMWWSVASAPPGRHAQS